MSNYPELSVEKLCFQCDESQFKFDTTETVPPLKVMIGQKRAVKAVEFGLFTKNQGYNIFISGLVGTGKMTYARAAVSRIAANEKAPGDWCYVNNFKNHGQPIALLLPGGSGHIFVQDMEELLEDIKTDVMKIFSSDDYDHAKNNIVKTFGQLQQ